MRLGTTKIITKTVILITLLGGLTLDAKTSNTSQSSFFRQTEIQYYWDESSEQWKLGGQTISTFNGSNQIIETLGQEWDGYEWTNSKRNTWTYDNNGYLTGELLESWDYSNEQWENYSKIEYINDSNGNQIDRTVIEYHIIPGFSQVWWNKWHSSYTYDSANKLIETINQTWDSSHWSNYDRYTYTYDAGGKLSVMLDMGWSTSTWLNENLTTYSYNSSGVQLEKLRQHWADPDQNGSYAWTNYRREQNHVDANNLIYETVSERWESTQWVYGSRTVFTFDNDFNITEILNQYWDKGTNNWLNDEQTLINYQNWGTIADFSADIHSGTVPLTVQFTDLSFQVPEGNPILSWAWDFDDNGTIDATTQNPSYTYVTVGTYTVTLIVSDGVSADTLKRNDFISALNSAPDPTPLLTVTDVPDDEGGELLIQFTASSIDVPPLSENDIYNVYIYEVVDSVWAVLETVHIPATGAASYSMSFSTVADFGDINNNYYYLFAVSAEIKNNVYYSEYIVTYSLDNLAPDPISTLNASVDGVSVLLSWNASPEPDFDYYIVYRAYTASMENPQQLTETDITNYTDSDITLAGDYYYQVAAVDIHGNHSEVIHVVHANIPTAIDESALPTEFSLHRNYPNPFNPVTTFQYALPVRQQVNLSVYDLKGNLVETLINSEKPAGIHKIEWNASTHGSGVYLYRIEAGEFHTVRKCILMK